MLKKILKQATCGLFFALTGINVLNAGAIGVTPVRVTLSANQKVSALTVTNPGTEPMSMQLELMNWSQQEGEDIFTATRDLLANPPIITLPPGGSQLIRVGLRRAPDMERELSYRLFLQQLPPPVSPDFQGAYMMMRISLPVFILPKVETKPALRWQLAQTPQGALKLSLRNNGNAHIQIKNFKLSLLDKLQPWVTQQTSVYVLPGQSHDWLLPVNSENPAPSLGTNLKLIAQTESDNIEVKIKIVP